MDNVKGLSYVTSPLSEYIGCNIYKILGFDVQDVLLGICNDGRRNKVVCACKDFIVDDKNELLVPYTALRNDTNPALMNGNDSSSLSASNIYGIISQLEYNTVLSNIAEAKERFWDVVIVDMLINNNDRNEDNWGVIKYKDTNSYRLAPIYDCGNCFYGKTSNDRIATIMGDEEKLLNSALGGRTAYEDDKEKMLLNNEILKVNNKDLKKEIKRLYPIIKEKLTNIITFIQSIPNEYNGIEIMSEQKKEYYIKTFELRLERILGEEYKVLNK